MSSCSPNISHRYILAFITFPSRSIVMSVINSGYCSQNIFLFKLQNIFSQITQSIYLNGKFICLTCKMCLSRTYYASFALLLVWHLSPSPPIHSYVGDKLGIPLTNFSRRYIALPLQDPSEVIESINVKEKAEY